MYITILFLVSQHVFGGCGGPSQEEIQRAQREADNYRRVFTHDVQRIANNTLLDQRHLSETTVNSVRREREEMTSALNLVVADIKRIGECNENSQKHLADTANACTNRIEEAITINGRQIQQTIEDCKDKIVETMLYCVESFGVQLRETTMNLEDMVKEGKVIASVEAPLLFAFYLFCSLITIQFNFSNVSDLIVKIGGFTLLGLWKLLQKNNQEHREMIEDNKEKKIATRELAINKCSDNLGKELKCIENGIFRINQFVGSWRDGTKRKRIYTIERNEYIVRNESGEAIWSIRERKNRARRITHFELRNKKDGRLEWEIESGEKHMVWEKVGSKEVDMSNYMPWANHDDSVKKQKDKQIRDH